MENRVRSMESEVALQWILYADKMRSPKYQVLLSGKGATFGTKSR